MKSTKWIGLWLLLSAGCAAKKSGQSMTKGSEELYAHRWALTELEGTTVTPTDPKRDAHLLFTPGQVNRVAGSTGCNRLNGTFDLSGQNKIKFSPLATTRMACPNSETERQFLAALERADNYRLVDTFLLLNSGKMQLARFTAADKP